MVPKRDSGTAFHPDLSKYRAEEKRAFEALFSHVNITQCPEFMEWEDKHHYCRSLENEQLYLQGMRDGAKLVTALLSDPFAIFAGQAGGSDSEK